MQARFMAEHRELEQSAVQDDAALHAPVNLVI